MNTPLAQTEGLYAGWEAQGATRVMFRPNDLCVELGLPLGQEKRLLEHQQIAVRRGALGTDHDAVFGFWTGISGFAYYVLARGHVDPQAGFDRWEEEYTAAFGAAQPQIRALLNQWRDRFERVILPADLKAQAAQTGLQRPGFLGAGALSEMSRHIQDYYHDADFDRADELLRQALARPLTPLQHRQVRRLLLANQHNRLTFHAMRAVAGGDDEQIRQEARQLLDFRTAVRDSLQINWWLLFAEQHGMGDACGITLLLKQERLADRGSLVCLRAARPPVMDGRLDEALWSAACTGVPFLTNQAAEAPRAGARALLAYDDLNLYVAVDCREPAIAQAVEKERQRDGTVWQDNAVEVFVDPACSKQDFYQLIVSSAGTLLDGRRVGGRFGVDWDLEVGRDLEYAVGKADSSWAVEIRLPFRAIGMDAPRPGQRVRFNVTRDRVVSGEESEATALSPTFGGFHLPQRFAELVFE
ncbi:MAG: carbohydrate-binding family 9-like protein [Candidatus Latescibacterota bacterium]